MNNYRRKPTRNQTRKVIDGILNAPINRVRDNPVTSNSKAQPHQVTNAVRSTRQTRQIGDFTKLSDGYHSADQTDAGRLTAQRSAQAHAAAPRKDMRQTIATEAAMSAKRLTHKERCKQKKLAKQQRKGRKKWFIRITIIIVLLILGVAGFLVAQGYLTLNSVLRGGGSSVALGDEVDPNKLKSEGDGRVNMLLLGRGGEGHDGPDLTDTILIASIDPVNKKATLISIPRDLWVKTDNGSSKINAVYAQAKSRSLNRGGTDDQAHAAGVAAADAVLSDVLGIDLHYYAMIDFEGFRKAVDTLGGVTINVPEELRDSSMAWQNGGDPVLVEAGTQTLDGTTALMYVRSRHGSARGDFDRAERQRLFIMALKNEITAASTYSNPLTISRLLSDFGAHVRTDFSVSDLSQLYTITSGITTVESIGLVDAPHNFLTTGNVSGQSIVQPKAGLFDYEAIQIYIRSALPDGYITKENAPIVVLNGTTAPGVATTTSETLKTYLYNVISADNAPTQDYSKTIIVDLTGKNPYTKNYLEQRFGVSATTSVPAGITVAEADKKGFIIIVGEDNT